MENRYQVLIVGGGAAGITVAASLKKRSKSGLSIAILEPSEDHYYQPALTLVGAGAYPLAKTRRDEGSLIPKGVDWVKAAASGFDPDNNAVDTSSGDRLTYDYLVVCTGVALDWDKIDGLRDTLDPRLRRLRT